MFLGVDSWQSEDHRFEDTKIDDILKNEESNICTVYYSLLQTLDSIYYILLITAFILISITYAGTLSRTSSFYNGVLEFTKEHNLIHWSNFSTKSPASVSILSPMEPILVDQKHEEESTKENGDSGEDRPLSESDFLKSYNLSPEQIAKLNLTVENLDFIHLAKNGGTAIENFGQKHLGRNWGRLKAFKTRGRSKTDFGLSCRFPWHVPPHLFKYNAYPLDWNFCVLRHPVSRLISEFNFRWLHRGRVPNNRGKRFHLTYPLSADGLNTWIKEIVDLYKQQMFCYDCHLIPMKNFIFDRNGTRWCHFVLKLENLDEDFGKLQRIFGFGGKLPVANVAGKKRKKISLNVTLTADDISQESMQLLRSLYEDDFLYYEHPENFKFFDLGI